ncbi:MAG: peptidoglycan DD-metalloendopeptidase family protein [Staphylococcus epidermidis]|nr:peptidoglycan DD-metalloendopeptidase family protein [Staphylococcus epidermidis]
MASVKELYAKISATAEGFNKTMDSISQKTRHTAKSISSQSGVMSKSLEGIGKAGRSFDNIGNKIQNVSKNVGGVGEKMTNSITKPAGIAVGAVGGLVGALGFKRLVGMDQAEAKLKGIGLAGKDVTKIQNQVSKSIEGSMTTMAEGTDLAAGALGSGVKEGKELEKYIKAAGNAAVGANVPVSEMGQIFSRVKGQGKLAGTELQMMEERLPGFTSTMAREMGLSMEEFRNKVSEGEVGYDEFLKGVEARAGKSAEAQSQTFMGMLTNTKNYLGMIGEAFLQPAFKEAKVVLADLVNTLNSDSLRQSAAEAGKVVAPAFAFLAKAVTGTVKAFLNLPGPVLGAIGALGGILIAIGPVLTGFAKLGGMIGGMFKTFGSLLSFVSALNPVGLIIMGIVAAVAALGTAFYIAYQKSETFRNFINGIGTMISGAIGWVKQFGQAIGALFSGNTGEGVNILEKLGFNQSQISAIQGMVSSLKSIFTELGRVLAITFNEMKGAWNGVASAFTGSIPFIKMAFSNMVAILGPIFMVLVNVVKTVFTTIISVIRGAFQMIQGVIQIFSGLVQGDWSLVWQGVVNIFKGFFGILVALVKQLVMTLFYIVKGLATSLGNALRIAFGVVKNIIVGIFNGIKWVVVTIFKGMVNAIVVSAQTLWLRITQIFNALKFAITAIWNGIKFVSVAVWNSIKFLVVGFVRTMKNLIMMILGGLKAGILAIWNGIKFVTMFVWNLIKNRVIANARIMKNLVVAIFRSLKAIVSAIWNGLKNFVILVWNTLKNRVIAITRILKNIVISVIRIMKNIVIATFRIMKNIVIAVWNALKNRVIAVARIMKNIVITVIRTLKNVVISIFRALKNVAIAIWNGIKNKVISLARTMKNVAISIVRAMKNAILGIWKALKNVTISIWNAIKNKVIGLARGLKSAALSVFRSLKSGITGIWNGIKSVTSKVWNGIKNVAIGAAKGMKSKVLGLFGSMKNGIKKQIDNIKGFMDKMVGGVKKGLNGLIKGVNWVAGKLGMDKLPEIKLHSGTVGGGRLVRNGKLNTGTMATVGDKGRGNGPGGFRNEMIRYPNGRMALTPNKDTTTFLPKGSSVYSGAQTHSLLSSLPKFSTGTNPLGSGNKKPKKKKKGDNLFGDAWDATKAGAAKVVDGGKAVVSKTLDAAAKGKKWLGDKVGDVLDWIDKPEKLLEKVLEGFGVNLDSFGIGKAAELPYNMMKGMYGKLKKAAIDKFKEWFEESSAGDGGYIDLSKGINFGFAPSAASAAAQGYPFARPHYGLDINYKYDKVYSTLSGTATGSSGWNGGFGQNMWIRAGNGLEAIYGHLHKLAFSGKKRVKPGTYLGISGGDPGRDGQNAGSSTGPHLHYEMRRNGKPFDPTGWLKKHNGGGKVGGSGSGNARKAIKKAQAILGGRYKSSYITEQMMRVAKRESNFQADAVNDWDVNARAGTPSKGMFQMIEPSFKAYAKKGHGNILNPTDQAISAMRYIVGKWVPIMGSWKSAFKRAGDYAYANGGIVNSPELAWIAEGGFSESVISHDPRKRMRSKSIHDKTGKMLGVDDDTQMLREIINILEAGNHLQSVNNNAVNRLLDKNVDIYMDKKKLTQAVNNQSADLFNSGMYNQGG